ncbi:DUF3106 domain-containing protein [Acidipila sp. EB88]|uniref:DUF3106 domain-containing protein n=1 Tax=Acidipila sp. EB88 TaxID=2305226 RepID=UPI00131582AE|nr:DUF3106 domain-containing protein [Acidipila sp. EB88]
MMKQRETSRENGGTRSAAACIARPLLVLFFATAFATASLCAQQQGRPEQRAPQSMQGLRVDPRTGGRMMPGQHLPQWFAQHQALPPNEQENALRSEPGFAHLPAAQQQQLIERLHHLDLEPPAQRQRVMERNERFMALPVERQQRIRGASQMLSQMNPDRRRAVRDAFHDLRNLPEDQRANALNSARFQAEYSPQEREVLGNLLSIEPYQP